MDIISEVEFFLIITSLITILLLWILFRGEKATDREGREPRMADPTLQSKNEVGDLPLYGSSKDYTSEMIGKVWSHPDTNWYRDKIKQERNNSEKKKAR